jgi:hypothetical protein
MNGIKILRSLGYRPGGGDIPELLSLAAAGKISSQRLTSHIYNRGGKHGL